MSKKEKELELEEIEVSMISYNRKLLRQILWVRKPPLTEQQVEEIISESWKTPLNEVLMNYPVLSTADAEAIYEEYFALEERYDLETEQEMQKVINLERAKRGLPQFNELPTISYDELKALGVVK